MCERNMDKRDNLMHVYSRDRSVQGTAALPLLAATAVTRACLLRSRSKAAIVSRHWESRGTPIFETGRSGGFKGPNR